MKIFIDFDSDPERIFFSQRLDLGGNEKASQKKKEKAKASMRHHTSLGASYWVLLLARLRWFDIYGLAPFGGTLCHARRPHKDRNGLGPDL
jgi:hypothetical protein